MIPTSDWGCMCCTTVSDIFIVVRFSSFTLGLKLIKHNKTGTRMKPVDVTSASEGASVSVTHHQASGFHVWTFYRLLTCDQEGFYCLLKRIITVYLAWPRVGPGPVEHAHAKEIYIQTGCLMWRTASLCTVNHCTAPDRSDRSRLVSPPSHPTSYDQPPVKPWQPDYCQSSLSVGTRISSVVLQPAHGGHSVSAPDQRYLTAFHSVCLFFVFYCT